MISTKCLSFPLERNNLIFLIYRFQNLIIHLNKIFTQLIVDTVAGGVRVVSPHFRAQTLTFGKSSCWKEQQLHMKAVCNGVWLQQESERDCVGLPLRSRLTSWIIRSRLTSSIHCSPLNKLGANDLYKLSMTKWPVAKVQQKTQRYDVQPLHLREARWGVTELITF